MTTEAQVSITCEDGIYEVMFQDMKPASLDHYFSELEVIFRQTEPTKKVCILLHTTPDLPAFQNLAARDRALRAKFDHVPYVRLAILYTNQSHQSFVNLMLRVVNVNRHMEMQLFQFQKRDAALAWLRR